MLSFLAVALIVIVTNAQNPVCLWGRTHGNNTLVTLNGLYTYDSNHNDKALYKKVDETGTTCGGTYYIWYSGTDWRISGSKGSQYFNAYCTQSDVESCSKGKWNVAGINGWEVDPNLYTISGSCPSWDCASVSSTVPGNNGVCQGPFDIEVAPNTWRNSAGYYWYFNAATFTWRCMDSNNYNYKACTGATSWYSCVTEQGWTDLSAGSSISLNYEFPDPTGSYSVTCTGSSTIPSPTTSPVSNSNPTPTTSPVSNNNPSPTTSPASNNNNPSPTASPSTTDGNPSPTSSPASNNNNPSPTTSPVANSNPNPTSSPVSNNNPSPTSSPASNSNPNPTASPATTDGNNGNGDSAVTIKIVPMYSILISLVFVIISFL